MKDGLLNRNVDDIIVRSELEKKLKSGHKLRVKHGVDPTNPRYHIGRAVVLWKLRELQNLGHKIVIIIGDFTATIGDSSDKQAERQPLTAAQVKQNEAKYLDQIGRVIDIKKAEVHHNSEWFNKMNLADFIHLAEQFTIQQMIERENFALRLKAHKPVGLHETLYPLLQGYDSVAVRSDLELGGTDQLFNMLAARTVQQLYKQQSQNVLTTNLLEGTDGRKMSSSWGNCIYLDEAPREMYGQVMTIRDELIPSYFRLATDLPDVQIVQIERDLAAGDNPRDSKMSLARHIVSRYHGETAATEAEAAWIAQFRDKQLPDDIPSTDVDKRRPRILFDIMTDHFGLSKSEARRLLEQNGVRVDGRVVTDAGFDGYVQGSVVQIGKRRFVKIRLK